MKSFQAFTIVGLSLQVAGAVTTCTFTSNFPAIHTVTATSVSTWCPECDGVKQPNTVSRTHDTSIPPGFTTTAVSCNTCPGGQSVATIPASLVSGSSSNTVPSNPSPSPNGLSSSLGNSASTTSPGTPQFTGAGSNTAKEGFLIMGVLAAFVPILFTCID